MIPSGGPYEQLGLNQMSSSGFCQPGRLAFDSYSAHLPFHEPSRTERNPAQNRASKIE